MRGMAVCAPATLRVIGPFLCRIRASARFAGWLRTHYACWQPARYEQIGQCAGHEQAMGVLLQPAIAHLGKAEHPLDDPDRMFNPGPHFGLGAVFRPLDLIDDTTVAVAAIDKVLRSRRVSADHRALAAVGLVAPHAGLL